MVCFTPNWHIGDISVKYLTFSYGAQHYYPYLIKGSNFFYPYIIRITDENMPNLKIEKENDTVLFALWHTNCFLFVGVSAAVADSLQRHATRLL